MAHMHIGLEAFLFPSAGHSLVGRFFQAAGEGKKPTCILIHGFPGTEQNHDIAYALRENGWHAVLWHPRGCWGSEGAYEIAGIVQDLTALMAYLKAQEWTIDWERLVLLGYSLGGAVAVEYAHNWPDRVRALVLVAPVADYLESSLSLEFAAYASPFLRDTNPVDLQRAWMAQAWQANPVDLIADLSHPIMVVAGERDIISPPALVKRLVVAASAGQWLLIPGADHIFSHRRQLLVDAVLAWITEMIPV